MSTRWTRKVIVPTLVLAVLIGGVAWAATNGPASPITGTAARDRPFLGAQGLSAGAQAGHLTDRSLRWPMRPRPSRYQRPGTAQ